MNTIEKALKKRQKAASKHVNKIEETKLSSNVFDQLAEQQKSHEESILSNIKVNEQINDIPEQKIQTNKVINKSKLIELNLKRLSHQGFLVPDSTNTILNEEYRQIKRPLLRNIRGKSAHPIENANIIQVTSSLQSEGKTFTAINLALSFAMEMDFNVLLVDADTIKSSISKTLFENGKLDGTELGLTNYLSGDVDDLSKIMLKTNIPKLNILPAGTRNHMSTELLNSEYMEKLITEFSQRYENRIVVMDSPPMLQTNDSRILAHKVGQIVFVVEQNKTEQSVVKNALSLLEPEMVVGLVLNKSRTTSQSGYYGYYDPTN